MEQYLTLSIQTQHDAAFSEVAKLAVHSGCEIMSTRLVTLGSHTAMFLLLAGHWDALAKFETGFEHLSKKLDLHYLMNRTEAQSDEEARFPYSVQLVSLESGSLAQKVTDFFTHQHIKVEELTLDTYTTHQTNTDMMTMTLTLSIPTSCLIANIREGFLLFCDENNIDAIIEPLK